MQTPTTSPYEEKPKLAPSEQQYFGRQTALGAANFDSERRTVDNVPTLVKNFAKVKQAAARANAKLGVLSQSQKAAIEQAAIEVSEGQFTGQFPTALVLGGGGTTTNMNFNEVLAARASEISGTAIHPNDHVNASQSTNDTYPTAMSLTVHELSQEPIEKILELAQAFGAKATEFEHVQRLGRTCLQDAVTLSVGQTHHSHQSALRRVATQLKDAVAPLLQIPLGATVLGTGIGAPEGYQEVAVSALAELTDRELTPSEDLFDSLAHLDQYAAIASAGSRAALTMAKIAADLRLLSSGPGGGLGEVTIPAVQAGSSIMPGKVNPVIPEYVMQLSYRVRGTAYTVEAAVAAGELELNIMEPIIVDSLINIFEDLASAASTFNELCIQGLLWNGERLESNASSGFDRWVKLAATEGYDVATAQVRAFRDATGE